MNITLLVTVVYMIAVITIGWYLGRRKGGVREFFIGGGRLHWILLVPFLMAEYVTATATVGASEMAHEFGVSVIWFFIGAPIGLTTLAFGLTKFYTSIKKITIGEVFAVLFDQKNRLLIIIFVIITTAVSSTSAFLGLGTILASVLKISYESGVWLSAAILVCIAFFGLRSIAVMGTVHFITIIVCFGAAAIASLNVVGGLAALINSLPTAHLDFGRMGVPTVAAWVIGSSAVKLISIVAVTAMFAAKDFKTARTAALATGIWIMAFALLPMVIGLSAYVLMPEIPSRLALWKMGEECGTFISIMLSIGVMAAVLSTTPAMLLGLGGIITRDIFMLIFPHASEKSQIIFSRMIIPFLVVITTLFALTQPNIVGMIVGMMQVRIIFVVILLVSVLWRRIHPSAAFFAALVGSVCSLLWFLAGTPYGIEPLWIALSLGIPVLVITSLVKKPSPFKGVPEECSGNRKPANGQ